MRFYERVLLGDSRRPHAPVPSWHPGPVAEGPFAEFPAFAPAFEPGPLGVGAYLVLLNLGERSGEAVRVVADCLENASNKRNQIGNMLVGELGWRPQLVGCVAILAAEPGARPLSTDCSTRPVASQWCRRSCWRRSPCSTRRTGFRASRLRSSSGATRKPQPLCEKSLGKRRRASPIWPTPTLTTAGTSSAGGAAAAHPRSTTPVCDDPGLTRRPMRGGTSQRVGRASPLGRNRSRWRTAGRR
jgi:hypothetical protein